jgi:hypothetical protein
MVRSPSWRGSTTDQRARSRASSSRRPRRPSTRHRRASSQRTSIRARHPTSRIRMSVRRRRAPKCAAWQPAISRCLHLRRPPSQRPASSADPRASRRRALTRGSCACRGADARGCVQRGSEVEAEAYCPHPCARGASHGAVRARERRCRPAGREAGEECSQPVHACGTASLMPARGCRGLGRRGKFVCKPHGRGRGGGQSCQSSAITHTVAVKVHVAVQAHVRGPPHRSELAKLCMNFRLRH